LIGGNPFSADVHATERIHAAPTGALVMLLTSSAEMLWVPQLIGHSGEIRPRLPAVTADSMRNCTAGRTTRQHHSDAAGRTEKPFGKRALTTTRLGAARSSVASKVRPAAARR
jgi:hypothetical protein